MDSSTLVPSFLQRLCAPGVRNVLLLGVGGDFDFVLGLLLYRELLRDGKNVIFLSNSFNFPGVLGQGERVFSDPEVLRVQASSLKQSQRPSAAEEVHLCSFLDEEFPDAAPHGVYACHARCWSAPRLRAFLGELVAKHELHAVVGLDGGSDSLLRGDEAVLGEPLHDAIALAAIAGLEGPEHRMLLTVGLGADRLRGVSDASSLRAIAELAEGGGFLGSVCLEAQGSALGLYRRGLEYIYERQQQYSTTASAIALAASGKFSTAEREGPLASAPDVAQCFLWPIMAMVFGFNAKEVADRSLICAWVQQVDPRPEPWSAGEVTRMLTEAMREGRLQLRLPYRIRELEWLPGPTMGRRADSGSSLSNSPSKDGSPGLSLSPSRREQLASRGSTQGSGLSTSGSVKDLFEKLCPQDLSPGLAPPGKPRKQLPFGNDLDEHDEEQCVPLSTTDDPCIIETLTLQDLTDTAVCKARRVVADRKEAYLSDLDFEGIFRMPRGQFAKLPKWKRDRAKKEAGIF